MDCLCFYFDYGILELDNNIVECGMCVIVFGWKNYFFVGFEVGGNVVVIVYILIEMVKFNVVDFYVWFVDIFVCIFDYKIIKVDDLMLWCWNG